MNIDAEKNGVTVWNYIEAEREEGGPKMFWAACIKAVTAFPVTTAKQ
jgi:hypothetical protein